MANDLHGNAATGASEHALDLYAKALRQFALYEGDPLATLADAVEDSPGFAMAHLANAHMNLAGSDRAALAVARETLEAVSTLSMNEREREHAAAVDALARGDFDDGHERLERIVIDNPRDLLGVQIAHLWDFLTGDARRLRERIAMVLPSWSESDREYHALLGMHAFGLEECGRYEEAEALGRQAVAMNHRDSWAQHAVAHVLEMQGRFDEGIVWMRGNEAGWAPDNFFAVHNWWHLALYHLEKGEVDEVLRLYDEHIRADRSDLMLDMVDASAMLWRLHLRGVDTGERFAALADDWAPFAEDGFYAFNDVHALMAFVGAGRPDDAARTIEAMEHAATGSGANARAIRDVGMPVARAIVAFGEGAHDVAVECLRPVRSIAARFGGSHAQRDVLDLTLIEAALRDGDRATAVAFTQERRARKPTSPLSWHLERRAREERHRAVA